MSVDATEALGAWVRLCHNKRKEQQTTMNKEAKSSFRPPREYCVAIAVRGSELFPASEAIKSGKLLMICICNFHVLSNLLLIYICKLHWNLNTMFVCQVNYF